MARDAKGRFVKGQSVPVHFKVRLVNQDCPSCKDNAKPGLTADFSQHCQTCHGSGLV